MLPNEIRRRVLTTLLGPASAEKVIADIYKPSLEPEAEMMGLIQQAVWHAASAIFVHENLDWFRAPERTETEQDKALADNFKRYAPLLSFVSYHPDDDSTLTMPKPLYGASIKAIAKGTSRLRAYEPKRMAKMTANKVVTEILSRFGDKTKVLAECSKSEPGRLRQQYVELTNRYSTEADQVRLRHNVHRLPLTLHLATSVTKTYLDMNKNMGLSTCMTKDGFDLDSFYAEAGAFVGVFTLGAATIARAIVWPVLYQGVPGLIVDRIYFRTPAGLDDKTMYQIVKDRLTKNAIPGVRIFQFRWSEIGQNAAESWAILPTEAGKALGISGGRGTYISCLLTSIGRDARSPYVDTYCNAFFGTSERLPWGKAEMLLTLNYDYSTLYSLASLTVSTVGTGVIRDTGNSHIGARIRYQEGRPHQPKEGADMLTIYNEAFRINASQDQRSSGQFVPNKETAKSVVMRTAIVIKRPETMQPSLFDLVDIYGYDPSLVIEKPKDYSRSIAA